MYAGGWDNGIVFECLNSVQFFTFHALFSPKGLQALSINDIVQSDETNQFILKVSLFLNFFKVLYFPIDFRFTKYLNYNILKGRKHEKRKT